MAESFVDTFKTELIADRVWRTRSQLELAVVEYVSWFNNERLHESLGDVSPAEFEDLYVQQGDQLIPLKRGVDQGLRQTWPGSYSSETSSAFQFPFREVETPSTIALPKTYFFVWLIPIKLKSFGHSQFFLNISN